MGSTQTMRGVVSAAINTFATFYDTQDLRQAAGQDLVAAAQACLLRLYSRRPNETIEAMIETSVNDDHLKVSDY
jgi:hypothetical protein